MCTHSAVFESARNNDIKVSQDYWLFIPLSCFPNDHQGTTSNSIDFPGNLEAAVAITVKSFYDFCWAIPESVRDDERFGFCVHVYDIANKCVIEGLRRSATNAFIDTMRKDGDKDMFVDKVDYIYKNFTDQASDLRTAAVHIAALNAAKMFNSVNKFRRNDLSSPEFVTALTQHLALLSAAEDGLKRNVGFFRCPQCNVIFRLDFNSLPTRIYRHSCGRITAVEVWQHCRIGWTKWQGVSELEDDSAL